jgi:hypothetical protein
VAARDEASPAADDLFLLRLQPDRLHDQPDGRSYWFALTNFPRPRPLLALLVGKAVLVADKFRAIDRFRGAPLIKPILYKTLFYAVVVTVFASIEQLVHFSFDDDGFRVAFRRRRAFTWHRFAAIQIWLFDCFLIYVTATEVSRRLDRASSSADVRSA